MLFMELMILIQEQVKLQKNFLKKKIKVKDGVLKKA